MTQVRHFEFERIEIFQEIGGLSSLKPHILLPGAHCHNLWSAIMNLIKASYPETTQFIMAASLPFYSNSNSLAIYDRFPDITHTKANSG